MNAIISMVEKTKEKSTEKVHFIVRTIFVTKRIKRVVQPQDRQKVRNKNELNFLPLKTLIHFEKRCYGKDFRD